MAMAADLFHQLLLLGLSANEVYAEEEEEQCKRTLSTAAVPLDASPGQTSASPGSAGRSRHGARTTTLSAACDLGPYFQDRKNHLVVDLCLKDLAFNPLRYATWATLLGRLVEAFASVLDELQKLVLLDRVPECCYEILSPLHAQLLHPTSGAATSSSPPHITAWRGWQQVERAQLWRMLDFAVTAVEGRCQASLAEVFQHAFARETYANLHPIHGAGGAAGGL